MSNKTKSVQHDKANAQDRTPRVRFPEFQSLPEWEEKRLVEVCEINPSSENLPDSFIYIDLESVVSGNLLFKNKIQKADAPSRAQRLLKNGDVVYQMVRPYQRNNFLCNFTDGYDYVASTGYAQLRSFSSSEFLFQVIHTEDFVNKVLAKCTGSSYPAINSAHLADINIFIPKPPEQQKIADCLFSIDEIIAAKSQKLGTLKSHRKGLMQQLFPAEGETVPKLRFPEFRDTGAWEEKQIGDLLIEQLRPIEMDDEQDYSLVTVKRRYGGIVSRGVFKGKSIKVKSQFLLHENDFLISKRQIVHNACGLVPKEFQGSIVSNEYSVLRSRRNCDIVFFNYFSQQPIVSESFLTCSIGIVIEKMLFKLNAWLKRKYLFPSLPEQQKIADCLSSIDELIAAQALNLEALKAHKKGLMQQLFPSIDEVSG